MENKKRPSFLSVFVKQCIFPFLINLLLGAAYFVYQFYLVRLINEGWIKYINDAFFVIALIFAAYFVRKIISSFFNWYTIRKESESAVTEFIPLFRRCIRIVVWTIALIILLSHFGININALVATLGVGSLAIALAAQDTISNIIAGFLIMVDRPFRIGDKIKLPTGEIAVALNIGIRRSRFRAEDRSIIIVPNQDLSKSKIVNYTYGEEEN